MEAVLVASETDLVLPSQRFASVIARVFARWDKPHPPHAGIRGHPCAELRRWGPVWLPAAAVLGWRTGCLGRLFWDGEPESPHGKGKAGEVRLVRKLGRFCKC